MKNKKILIPLFLLFLMSFAIAEDFTLDENSNRFKSYAFVKGTIASFKLENKIYLIEMGDIDFEHERVTIEWVSPRLGTEILNLNEPIDFDLDKDDENDVKITLINHDKDAGINEDGIKGTATLMFEILSDTILETSTTIETTTTTIEEDNISVAGQDITGSQVKETPKIDDYKNWIIRGVIALILLLIIITRKNIANLFKNISKEEKKEEKKEPKEHIACPTCRRDTVVGDKYCIGCGAKLAGKPKFCTKCGENIRAESKFCASCGAKIGK